MNEGISIGELKVELSEKAKKYILSHGGILTLEEAPQTGCCVNHIFVGAHLGKPQDEGFYGVREYQGIKIFYDPLVTKDKKHEVDLEGILGWKTLVVY